MRVRFMSLVVLVVLALGATSVAHSDPASESIPASGTLDHFAADGGHVGAAFYGDAGSSSSSGYVEMLRTWKRDGFEHYVSELAEGPLPLLVSDLGAGTSHVRGTVRSVVTHRVYRATEPYDLVSTSTRRGSISFDLTWTKDGTPRVVPPRLNTLCLVCVQSPVQGTSDARVDGRIRFQGLGRAASVEAERGQLTWAYL